MENNKVHIEELIREIDAEKRKGPKLDADKIIRQANLEIERRELQKKKRRTGYIATASVLVVVICVSFTYLSLSTGGYADNFRQFFNRNNGSSGEKHIDNFIDGESKVPVVEKEMALEELMSLIDFELKLPQKIPEEYTQQQILARLDGDTIMGVKIYYVNFENENLVTYEIIPSDYKKARVDTIDYDESELKTILNNQIEYTYTINNEDITNLIYWEEDEVFYTIYGNESDETLLQMAYSVN